MDLAVYAVDVGSIPQKRLGWARADVPGGGVDPEAQTDIERLVDAAVADLAAGGAVALGFECPLYVPVPADSQLLGKARKGTGTALGRRALARAPWQRESCRRRGRCGP